MANQFASDKKYLELAGLRALILKIGAMREEYVGLNQDVVDALTALLERVNHIIAVDTDDRASNKELKTDSYNYDDKATLFECVAKYIQGLRDELGTSADAKPGSPIYARLDQLELDVQKEVTGLLDRTTKLEKESFAGVECSSADDVKANHLWEAIFKNAAGEALKTADGKDMKISLDTKDFIIDGMLGDVKMISVVNRGAVIIDLTSNVKYEAGDDQVEPWKTLINESATRNDGERYLVFTFKTKDSDGHDDTNNNYAGENELKNIWVSMHDLHDNFEFKGEGAKYIELVAADPEHTADGSTKITYKVNLADDVVAVLEKALGENPNNRSYDDIDADLKHAQEDIVTNRADIDTNREDIDELQGYVKDGWTNSGKEVPGLLDRADDIEAWIDGEGVIPAEFVEDYFDWVVFSGNAKEDRIDAYNKINDDPKRGIDKTWAEGHTPTVDDEKYKPVLSNE